MSRLELDVPAFISSLLGEVEAIDPEAFPPTAVPVQQGEVILGEASLYARKLFALTVFYTREHERIVVEEKYTSAEDEKDKLNWKMGELKARQSILFELLYAVLRDELGLWDQCCCGMRAEWKVVHKTHGHEPGDFLKRMFGIQ